MKQLLSFIGSAMIIATFPLASFAYDDDTHFWFTYYLARKTGYTVKQATQIASANLSVDYDCHTDPVLPGPDSFGDLFRLRKYHQRVRTNLHALVDKQERTNYPEDSKTTSLLWDLDPEPDDEYLGRMDKSVDASQDRLWRLTLTSIRNPGVFLHFAQDRYPHRGFTSLVGHAGYFYIDHLGRDIKSATTMALESVAYLIEYRRIANLQFPDIRTRSAVLKNAQELSDDDMRSIKEVIFQLAAVNPSNPEPQQNDLYRRWRNRGDIGSINKIRLTLEAIKLKKRYDVRPSPAAARTVVLTALDEVNVPPNAWKYDLRANGTPAKKSTNCKLKEKAINGRGFFDDSTICRGDRINFALDIK